MYNNICCLHTSSHTHSNTHIYMHAESKNEMKYTELHTCYISPLVHVTYMFDANAIITFFFFSPELIQATQSLWFHPLHVLMIRNFPFYSDLMVGRKSLLKALLIPRMPFRLFYICFSENAEIVSHAIFFFFQEASSKILGNKNKYFSGRQWMLFGF